MTSDLDRSARDLDRSLRACVQCGLCLPVCATYLATGNEVHSPRGRLLLLKEVQEGRTEASDPAVQQAFAACLGCMACSATCPSGVSFDLFDLMRATTDRHVGAWNRRTAMLDRRWFLAGLRRASSLMRRVLQLSLGGDWRILLARTPRLVSRVGHLLGIVPMSFERDHELVTRLDALCGFPFGETRDSATRAVAVPGSGPTLAWFQGCADAALLPGTQRRLAVLFESLGCSLVVPEGQDCCGAIAAHTGRPRRAAHLREKNARVFADHLDRCDHVVVAAAGCGRELALSGSSVRDRVVDAVVLLDRLAPAGLGSVPLRVALHDPCHARHGQGIVDEPRRLICRIPDVTLLEPELPDVCCGGAGVYSVRNPELSRTMGLCKASDLLATDCDLVVTSNPGCLGQIADSLALLGSAVPVIPLSDLVWYAWLRGHQEGRGS